MCLIKFHWNCSKQKLDFMIILSIITFSYIFFIKMIQNNSTIFEYFPGGRVDKDRSLASVERYNPAADTWEEMAPISTPRRSVAVCAHNGRLYAMGGSGRILPLVGTNKLRTSWRPLAAILMRFSGGPHWALLTSFVLIELRVAIQCILNLCKVWLQ